MSFFLVRLLQNFSAISVAQDAQVPPPAVWKLRGGVQAREKVWPKSHLTLYATVSLTNTSLLFFASEY